MVTKLEPNGIVIKSTIPVGFVDKFRKCVSSNNIIFSPEFLREGFALKTTFIQAELWVKIQKSKNIC